jgi:transcriptional regulator with XRE-family HTH domain
MSTGERIREARIRSNLTQKELANKIGVKFSAIHKYETGRIVNLKRETIEALAVALNVKPSWLLCLDEEEQNKHIMPLQFFAESEIQSLYNDLPENGKQELLRYARYLKQVMGEGNAVCYTCDKEGVL